jgi:hypothetical protein
MPPSQRYPLWLSVKLEVAPPPFAVERSLIDPLISRILALPGITHCAYVPEIMAGDYYLYVDYAAGSALEPLLKAVSALIRPELWPEALRSASVEPYQALGIEMLGGEAFMPVLSQWGHFHSRACLKLFRAYEEPRPPNLLAFAFVSSVVATSALGLTQDEAREVFATNVRQLEKATGIDTGTPEWEDSLAALSDKLQALSPCLRGIQADWSLLEDVLPPPHLSALRELSLEAQAPALAEARERSGAWTRPFIDVLARRIVHLIWLRLGVENQREVLCMKWLQRLPLQS